MKFFEPRGTSRVQDFYLFIFTRSLEPTRNTCHSCPNGNAREYRGYEIREIDCAIAAGDLLVKLYQAEREFNPRIVYEPYCMTGTLTAYPFYNRKIPTNFL